MATIFPLNLYWSSTFEIINGAAAENNQRADATIFMTQSMSFAEFEKRVYQSCGADRRVTALKFVLVWPDKYNVRRYIHFLDDSAMLFLYTLAHRRLEVYVTRVQIQSTHHASTSERHEKENNGDGEDDERDMWKDEDSEEYVPSSEDDDESDANVSSSTSGRFVNSDIGDWDHCIDEDADMPKMWDGSAENIGLGIHFKSKEDAMAAVTLWSARRGKTFHTVDSRKKSWAVQCITRAPNYLRDQLHNTQCEWSIRASLQKHIDLWKMVKWTEVHNCTGGNPAQNVNSGDIARLIMHKVHQFPNYPIKSIQSDVTNIFKVQVSYKKAWHARRKALELVFGD